MIRGWVGKANGKLMLRWTLCKWGYQTHLVFHKWWFLSLMGKKSVIENWLAGTILRDISVRACSQTLLSKLQSSRWKIASHESYNASCSQTATGSRDWRMEKWEVNNRMWFHVGWEQDSLLRSLWKAGTSWEGNSWDWKIVLELGGSLTH